VTVHEYIIPHVLIFRQHNGDDPPQDWTNKQCSESVSNVGKYNSYTARFTMMVINNAKKKTAFIICSHRCPNINQTYKIILWRVQLHK